MRLHIHGQGLTFGGAERERVERRFGFALGRFGDSVGRVTVHLVDVNGPRGGADKRCRAVVEVAGHRPVVVEDADARLEVAIDRAADRVGRAVRRQLDLARAWVPAVSRGRG